MSAGISLPLALALALSLEWHWDSTPVLQTVGVGAGGIFVGLALRLWILGRRSQWTPTFNLLLNFVVSFVQLLFSKPFSQCVCGYRGAGSSQLRCPAVQTPRRDLAVPCPGRMPATKSNVTGNGLCFVLRLLLDLCGFVSRLSGDEVAIDRPVPSHVGIYFVCFVSLVLTF